MRLRYSLKATTSDTSQVVPTSEAKLHAAAEETSEDDQLFDEWIAEATEELEKRTQRSFLTKTFEQKMDGFPAGPIDLQRAPVVAITSVQYYDTSNTLQTWDSSLYDTDIDSEPGRIYPVSGESYPATRDRLNAVIVTFTAGYGTTGASAPAVARQAIRFWTAEAYRTREPGMLTPEAMRAWNWYIEKLRWKHYG